MKHKQVYQDLYMFSMLLEHLGVIQTVVGQQFQLSYRFISHKFQAATPPHVQHEIQCPSHRI